MPSIDLDRPYVLGIHATPVGRHPEQNHTGLARDALAGSIKDAELPDPGLIEATWFSSSVMDYWNQRGMRGQAALGPLIEEGLLPNGQRITNVEGACASGSLAFNGAVTAVQQGMAVAAAVGVEKMNDPDRPGIRILQWLEGTGNQLDPDWYWAPFRDLAEELGTTLESGEDRSFAIDTYALLARSHMRRYGTTADDIASAAAKNHTNAVHNRRAQYHFPMSTADVLADRPIADPLTRAMCAPRGDAAAAVLVCSGRYLATQPKHVQERALSIRAHTITGGWLNSAWEDQRSSVQAAARAYQMATLQPSDLNLIELHDATSFAEIYLVEDLGLCERGDGGPLTRSGATQRDGAIPVNPSGGLVARGHPIGATGIIMLNELALQLRHEAGDVQIPGARLALAENGGGFLGLDNALCAVTILQNL